MQAQTVTRSIRSTRRLDQEDFLRKANETHKGKYDYSRVKYRNCYTKVRIKCPEHGFFWQRPNNHIAGQGCPKCIDRHFNNLSNTKEFKKRAKLVHGNTYCYDKVRYVNSITPVKIICSIHGNFEQKPVDHLQGRRCPKCYHEFFINKPFTTEEFVQKAREVHGDKYDYSKTVYVKSTKKIIITCPKHGDFVQMPNSHLHGYGCKKCSLVKTTKEDFISRAKEVHGDKYDYSKVEYEGRNKKVIITCPVHGDFLMRPFLHLYGYGCRKCAFLKRRGLMEAIPIIPQKIKTLLENFLEKAREVHGDKYNYDKVVIRNGKRVTITCPTHGDFKLSTDSHLNGRGCRKCVKEKSFENVQRIFLENAKKKYKDKYSYDKVVFEKPSKKVIITCPIHGDFKQTPYKFLRGCECWTCRRLERK